MLTANKPAILFKASGDLINEKANSNYTGIYNDFVSM